MTGFRLAFVLLAGAAAAEKSAWSQCGGKNYHDETICVTGYTCVRINDQYSQCQAGKATASMTTVVTPPTKPTPSSKPGAFRFLGRVNPATKELTWPGTGISFTFTGTSATIGLASVSGESSVELTVDGNATVIPKVSGTSISTPQLSQGVHTVSMRKRSEAYMGSIVIGTVITNGTLKVEAVPKRQVEIIGDSITVGYGLDGVNPCTNNAEVENNPKTYAALAASALGADYNVIAWSGKGIIRNYPSAEPDTSPIIPQLWTRYAPNDADGSYLFPASWNPEAVVINLGTNDFNYIAYNSSGQAYRARENLDPKAYTSAMVKFVQTIKSHYKKASFFLLNSPMMSDTFPTAEDAWKTTQTNALKDAIAQLNGTKAYLVDWPSQGSDVGCDYHPNAATNAAEAKVLQAAIAEALKWK